MSFSFFSFLITLDREAKGRGNQVGGQGQRCELIFDLLQQLKAEKRRKMEMKNMQNKKLWLREAWGHRKAEKFIFDLIQQLRDERGKWKAHERQSEGNEEGHGSSVHPFSCLCLGRGGGEPNRVWLRFDSIMKNNEHGNDKTKMETKTNHKREPKQMRWIRQTKKGTRENDNMSHAMVEWCSSSSFLPSPSDFLFCSPSHRPRHKQLNG